MSDKPIHLAILVGSNREGRFAPVIARWFTQQVQSNAEFSVDVIDLADVALPAAITETPSTEAVSFCERLAAADAFVMVVPEYNHSFPAVLKHAIDFGYQEWQAKPVGFVSYGGFAAGLRAVEHLRGVMAELHAMTMRDTVSFQNPWDAFDDEGRPVSPGGCARAAAVMLHQLKWWATALRNARVAEPYTEAPAVPEKQQSFDAA
ncbi:NAD(P)H-dependent oxidoreductase [Chelativorans sp. M5D2P16]|uniref:NADPH-dependent FMN reductase n=1 Tax=Chelativorans sp. M5D2P16 TaxID=3095678 RepID=UPI002ACA3F49|nr:NAD(P)H-dependent oxidoreductase [Chelativorans sp. M5D2P16]MDZ5697071.1 NAD(P)H-dependent oxidoreductase [Chelativorans sp. M5D2P16]